MRFRGLLKRVPVFTEFRFRVYCRPVSCRQALASRCRDFGSTSSNARFVLRKHRASWAQPRAAFSRRGQVVQGLMCALAEAAAAAAAVATPVAAARAGTAAGAIARAAAAGAVAAEAAAAVSAQQGQQRPQQEQNSSVVNLHSPIGLFTESSAFSGCLKLWVEYMCSIIVCSPQPPC